MTKIKKKNNVKFAISASLALLVLFGSTIGIGYWIGKANKRDDNYVKFFIHNKEYKLNDSRTTKTAGTAEQADDLISKYYSAALFGNENSSGASGTSNDTYDYIFNEKAKDWNQPFQIGKPIGTTPLTTEALHEDFTYVKFAKDTISTTVFAYLTGLNSTNPKVINAINSLTEITDYQTLNFFGLAATSTGKDALKKIIEALTKDSSYQKGILEDMYIYSYLWQDSSMSIYDYNLTREIVKAAPSLVESVGIDSDKIIKNSSADKNMDTLKALDDSGTTVSNADWNAIISNLKIDNALIDPSIQDNAITTVGFKGFEGFEGIKFGTSAGDGIKEDWTDSTKTWNTDNTSNDISGPMTTMNGKFNHNNILEKANYYIPKDNDNGAIIGDSGNGHYGDISGDVNVYAYSQLIPYTFSKKIETGFNNNNYNMGTNHYSLFANGDNSAGWTTGDKDNVKSKYIFDEWFGNNSIYGEIYLTESLIDNNPDIKTRAYNYWNDKGFGIELSGKYQTDFGSSVPSGLIRDDE